MVKQYDLEECEIIKSGLTLFAYIIKCIVVLFAIVICPEAGIGNIVENIVLSILTFSLPRNIDIIICHLNPLSFFFR